MRNILIWIVVFIPLAVNSQTFFTNGMTWCTQISGTHSPNAEGVMEYVTVENTEAYDIFKMYRSYNMEASDLEFIAYIKVEGEKVYFKIDESEVSDWYLFYDFGMKPGEGCYVYSPLVLSEDLIPYGTYIKCVDIFEYSENHDWNVLTLEEFTNDSCSDSIGHGTWIKGLSSLNGILYNNRFEMDGVKSNILLEVLDKNKTIFSNKSSGIIDIYNCPTLSINIKDRELLIVSNLEINGSIFSISGIYVGNYQFNEVPTSINITVPGVYILKYGTVSKIILIN